MRSVDERRYKVRLVSDFAAKTLRCRSASGVFAKIQLGGILFWPADTFLFAKVQLEGIRFLKINAKVE